MVAVELVAVVVAVVPGIAGAEFVAIERAP